MSSYEIISSLIAVLAIIVSVVSLNRTHKLSKRLLELEEVHGQLSARQIQALNEEERKSRTADLSVNLERMKGGMGNFHISNAGPATATNIFFCLTDENEVNPMVKGDMDSKLPYKILNKGDHFKLAASFGISVRQNVFHVELRWTNEDGTEAKKSFAVG